MYNVHSATEKVELDQIFKEYLILGLTNMDFLSVIIINPMSQLYQKYGLFKNKKKISVLVLLCEK